MEDSMKRIMVLQVTVEDTCKNKRDASSLIKLALKNKSASELEKGSLTVQHIEVLPDYTRRGRLLR